mgnify:CR=1 FL=1
MERVNRILQHNRYHGCLQEIQRLEAGRIFCGHDMAHFMDVARLAYIFNLEEGLGISKELIYASALLHDVGRHLQYLEGTPHEKAGLPLAREILQDCGFTEAEQRMVLGAISSHRDRTVRGEASLRGILYRADKMSRACYGCMAEKECDWSPQKKNLRIEY